MEHTPRVSALMSVYNGETHLRETVDSVLSQTFNDFEFLIINDGSTDGTQEILESYKDKRIRIFNQNNIGLTKSLNKGIQLSTGEYIARMDADDISLPERLQKQVRFLDEHPEIGVVGSFHCEINPDHGVQVIKGFPTEDREIKANLIKKSPFSHPTVMIRKNIFEKAGLYNEDIKYRYIEDYELWFRLANSCRFSNIPEALVIRRITPMSISVLHNTIQLKNVVHLRFQMLREKRFPWWYGIYLIKPYFGFKTHPKFRNLIRKYLFRNMMYS